MADLNGALDATAYTQEVMNRWKAIKLDFKDRDEKVAHYRRLYGGEHYHGARGQGLDPVMPRNVLNNYTNNIDLAVGMLISNQLDYQVLSQAGDRLGQERASLQEQFMDGLFYVNSERQEEHLRYWWTLRQLMDGAVGLRCYWDPIRHQSYRQIGQDEASDKPKPIWVFDDLPLVIQVIPIDYLYAEPGGHANPWQYLFYAEERTVYEVETEHAIRIARFANLQDRDKRLQKHTYLDYWRERAVTTEVANCPACHDSVPAEARRAGGLASIFGYVPPCPKCGSAAPPEPGTKQEWVMENAVFYGEQLIVAPRVMKGYDFYPYTIMWCKPVEKKDRKDWSHGLLETIDEAVYAKEMLLNKLDRQLALDMARGLVSKTVGARGVTVDAAFGKTTNLRLEEDLGYYDAMGTPEDLKYKLAELDRQIQEGGFPVSMYGGGPSQTSGYALSLMGDAGRIRLTQVVQGQKQALTVVARKCQRLMGAFASDIAVDLYGQRNGKPYAHRVTGADLQGYRINVELTPQYPNEDVKKIAAANQTRGILSEETIFERYLNVQQPDQEKIRKMAEMVEGHPAMVHYSMIRLLQAWAQQGDPAAQYALKQMLAEGPTDKPGPDKKPPNAEQLPGQPSSVLGGFPPQQLGGAPPGQEGISGMPTEFPGLTDQAPGA